MNNLESVKNIINDSITFQIIDDGIYFPPLQVLNEYLMGGTDPADQDNLYSNWQPFGIDEANYNEVKNWWLNRYPNAKEDWLGLDITESYLWFTEAYERI